MDASWLDKYPRAAAMLQGDDDVLEYAPEAAAYRGRLIVNARLPAGAHALVHFDDDHGVWQLTVQRRGFWASLTLGPLPSAPAESPEFYDRYLAPALAAMEDQRREQDGNPSLLETLRRQRT
jgi:hypothetical protein